MNQKLRSSLILFLLFLYAIKTYGIDLLIAKKSPGVRKRRVCFLGISGLILFQSFTLQKAESFYFQIKNSSGNLIKDAVIYFNEKQVFFDSIAGAYVFSSASKEESLSVNITHPSYRSLHIKKYTLSNPCPGMFYLQKKEEQYYYNCGVPYPCYSDPRFLFIQTLPNKEGNVPVNPADIEKKLKRLLLPMNLIVYRSFYDKDKTTNQKSSFKKKQSPLAFSFIVCRRDTTPFQSDSCDELVQIRNIGFVNEAGSLFSRGPRFEHPSTYRKFISVYFKREINDARAREILLMAGAKKIVFIPGDTQTDGYYTILMDDSKGLDFNHITETLQANPEVKMATPEIITFINSLSK